MSGGAFAPHFYRHIDDAVELIRSRATTSRHRALADHLAKVGAAVKAFDLVLSYDAGPGDEDAAIDAVVSPGQTLETLITEAQDLRNQLNLAIENASRMYAVFAAATVTGDRS